MLKMFYEKEESEEKAIQSDHKSEKSKRNPPGSIDLLYDSHMEQFFRRGIRGGQSFISMRHAKGEHDPQSSGNHLLYVDGKTIIFIKNNKNFTDFFSNF